MPYVLMHLLEHRHMLACLDFAKLKNMRCLKTVTCSRAFELSLLAIAEMDC